MSTDSSNRDEYGSSGFWIAMAILAVIVIGFVMFYVGRHDGIAHQKKVDAYSQVYEDQRYREQVDDLYQIRIERMSEIIQAQARMIHGQNEALSRVRTLQEQKLPIRQCVIVRGDAYCKGDS